MLLLVCGLSQAMMPAGRDSEALNYFDGVTVADSAAVARFFEIVDGVSDRAVAAKALGNAAGCLKGDGASLDLLLRGGERRYYDPDAGLLDEELFLAIVEPAVKSGKLGEDDADVMEYYLSQLKMNREGSVAADFDVALADGGNSTLHSLVGQEGAIVLFYDPECDTCHAAMDRMKAAGEKNVVAVAFLAEDDGWMKDVSCYPASWCFCRPVADIEEIYSIVHVPTLYGLDGGCRVKWKRVDYR